MASRPPIRLLVEVASCVTFWWMPLSPQLTRMRISPTQQMVAMSHQAGDCGTYGYVQRSAPQVLISQPESISSLRSTAMDNSDFQSRQAVYAKEVHEDLIVFDVHQSTLW